MAGAIFHPAFVWNSDILCNSSITLCRTPHSIAWCASLFANSVSRGKKLSFHYKFSPRTFCKGLSNGERIRCGSPFPEICKVNVLVLVRSSLKLALCYTLAATILFSHPCIRPTFAIQSYSDVPDISLLMSGQPIKDPEALLRYALPIDNTAIRGIQKNLENVSENLTFPGTKAYNSANKNIEQAIRVLQKYKTEILDDIPDERKDAGKELINRLMSGLQDLQTEISLGDKGKIKSMQKGLLKVVQNVEEDMVDKFPFSVPQQFAEKPLLKGRATVEMKVRAKANPDIKSASFALVLDGYNAPVTSGNFLDLVERHFYDGMEIQQADGLLVQTGDPEGPADGFVDPETGKNRTIPLEIMVAGDKAPIYGKTLKECGRQKAQTKLPFNASGTMAMARDEMENDSASSQIFWLVKEISPSHERFKALDGRYSVFGYVVENQDCLANLKVGDVIESMRVVSGIENLVNPTYRITV
eukprot:TRINITY_DN29186_c0_g1_i1.p1 TRINITY_DN29186_c0_g1~~TRINITY_DN29186_c0_g1_i1.p1  ORF type:complete len:472 (+),score=93.13 TRINITY_DN29186_c0_g1_i1:140-1555(+)